MIIKDPNISGLKIVYFNPHNDSRGTFSRVFCSEELSDVLNGRQILQINHSKTRKQGVLRGMHYQIPPYSEMKFVRCIRGRVYDVMVDLRKNSDTFLHWHAEELHANDNKMLVIPEGFAHGFQTLERDTELLYYHTALYNPNFEAGMLYNEPFVRIDWPLEVLEISCKDKSYNNLTSDFEGIEI